MKAPGFKIQITRTGYLFIILCLAIGIAGLNTGNNLLYLIFGMMCSFLILSGLLSNNTLTNLKIFPRFPTRIFAQDFVPVRLDLSNQKRFFPSFAVALVPKDPGIQNRGKAFVLKVLPQGKTSTVQRISFANRGQQSLPKYQAETSYPFGLIKKYISIGSQGDTIVFPKLVPIQSILSISAQTLGEYLSGQKGGASNPYGIRDYVPGDPARFIHWKTSAKRGEWKVKEFEREKRMNMILDVHLAQKKSSQDKWLECALSVAASLLIKLASEGFELHLRLNGKNIKQKGHGFLDAYLASLALAQPPANGHKSDPLPFSFENNSWILVTDLPRSHVSQHADLVIAREELESLK